MNISPEQFRRNIFSTGIGCCKKEGTMWFEIFKAGTHQDSAGNERTWSEEDLDTIVSKYNPSCHEAPIVIGHPKDNAPAWGWVEGLKREGTRLLAKAKDVVPEFKEMVNKGLFKKRSISLYPDFTLRHVGFLGAIPPAVKGLADVQFSEDNLTTIEFEEYQLPMVGRIFQRLREWLIEKFDTDTADKIVGSWEIDELKQDISPDDAQDQKITNAFKEGKKAKEDEDMDKVAELEAKIKQLEKNISDYSEKDKTKEQQIADLKLNLEKERSEKRKTEFNTYCDGLVREGKLTPAQKVLAVDFMEILSDTAEYEFAEADGKVKKAPLEAFKTFLNTLPKQVEFKETATKDRASTLTGKTAEKIEALIQDKLKADKTLNYNEALTLVQQENPQLAEEYAAEIKG